MDVIMTSEDKTILFAKELILQRFNQNGSTSLFFVVANSLLLQVQNPSNKMQVH